MSGLENIISRLEEDNRRECEKILEDAVSRAETIIADAEERAKLQSGNIIAEAEKNAELIRQKALSSSALDSRRTMLGAKVELVEGVLNGALHKLQSLDIPSYFRVLKILAQKNILPGEGIMLLNAEDLKRMPADFKSGFESIKISDEPCDIKDGFILKYGEIEVNCTFSAMLNASKEELKTVAVKILFG